MCVSVVRLRLREKMKTETGTYIWCRRSLCQRREGKKDGVKRVLLSQRRLGKSSKSSTDYVVFQDNVRTHSDTPTRVHTTCIHMYVCTYVRTQLHTTQVHTCVHYTYISHSSKTISQNVMSMRNFLLRIESRR